MIYNVMLDNAVTNATSHGFPNALQMTLSVNVAEHVSDEDSRRSFYKRNRPRKIKLR